MGLPHAMGCTDSSRAPSVGSGPEGGLPAQRRGTAHRAPSAGHECGELPGWPGPSPHWGERRPGEPKASRRDPHPHRGGPEARRPPRAKEPGRPTARAKRRAGRPTSGSSEQGGRGGGSGGSHSPHLSGAARSGDTGTRPGPPSRLPAAGHAGRWSPAGARRASTTPPAGPRARARACAPPFCHGARSLQNRCAAKRGGAADVGWGWPGLAGWGGVGTRVVYPYGGAVLLWVLLPPPPPHLTPPHPTPKSCAGCLFCEEKGAEGARRGRVLPVRARPASPGGFCVRRRPGRSLCRSRGPRAGAERVCSAFRAKPLESCGFPLFSRENCFVLGRAAPHCAFFI